MRALQWFIGHIFSWSLDLKGWMISYRREVILLCSNIYRLRQIGLLRQQPHLPALYLSVNHDIHTVRSDMHVVCSSMFPKVVWRKKLRSLDTSNIMTFCQIFQVASRVRQKVVDHRSLTIEKCSVQEKKVVGDKRSLMTGSLMIGSTVISFFWLTLSILDVKFFFIFPFDCCW